MLVLSYSNINQAASGGARRVGELLRSLEPNAVLIQPRTNHPSVPTRPFPLDLGQRKAGINWGIFNFFWRCNRRVVERALDQEKSRVVILTSIWNDQAVRRRGGLRMVLDAQNVEAVAIEERFGAWHPFTRMVERYERGVLAEVAKVLACSEADKAEFHRRYGLPPNKVEVIPNGVEISLGPSKPGPIAPEIEQQLTGKKVLFFMGKLDYQPNRLALDFISEQMARQLDQAAPQRFVFLICGGPVPPAPFHPSMIFAGRVPDIAPYLARADLCVAPIFSGSGTRLKILEYLAARKPVAATPKAAEGLACESGRQLLLAEPKDMAAAILRLADNPAEADQLARAGFEHVREHFDWKQIRPRWRQAILP